MRTIPRLRTFSTLRLVVPLALVLSLAPAGAEHCVTWSTSQAEVDTDPGGTIGGPRFYADNDVCQVGCLFSLWVYEETNGIPGLQRGDEVVDDTCHGMIEPDTLDL